MFVSKVKIKNTTRIFFFCLNTHNSLKKMCLFFNLDFWSLQHFYGFKEDLVLRSAGLLQIILVSHRCTKDHTLKPTLLLYHIVKH